MRIALAVTLLRVTLAVVVVVLAFRVWALVRAVR
jgi:hypothetical protein